MVIIIMTNVLDAAFDAITADPNLGSDAVYRRSAVTLFDGRVRFLDRDETMREPGWGDGGLTRPVRLVRLRVADVAQPAEGDTVEIGGQTYPVLNWRYHGTRRTRWSIELGDPA